MAMKDNIKRLIGIELGSLRRERCLCLEEVAALTKLPPAAIDQLELGKLRTWRLYRELLNFYGKTLKIELIDKPETKI
uniref:HTH cro/C1-type domain-containing protein n=1 Tax=uncultured Alphaproteobacteria bacterium TaxID=91750 RepID=A0A6G8F3B7_9PROT|nr:hypothetical protein PlAlph_6810 [uncultured Alphaproteobacteria bacterium]